jgi:hypothetical protein
LRPLIGEGHKNLGHTGAEEKDLMGRKEKGSSEKPSERDYQPLRKIHPYFEEKSS